MLVHTQTHTEADEGVEKGIVFGSNGWKKQLLFFTFFIFAFVSVNLLGDTLQYPVGWGCLRD